MNLHFNPILRVLHWLMAGLIFFMLFIGVGMVSTTGPAYVTLLALHRPIGMAIFLLAAVRLGLRLFTVAPDLPADLPEWQVWMAKGVHVILYGLMLALPLIGWAMLSSGGYPVRLLPFLSLPPVLPVNLAIYGILRLIHGGLAFGFFALITGHTLIALAHGFIRHDGVLRSMTFGRPADRA